jgi:putative transposase
VNWHLRESMTEADIEVILERAKELHPEARPRIIPDNGPQFIAKDFKEFIRVSGMTHVRTSRLLSPIERKNRALAQIAQGECIRPGTPLSLEDAWSLVKGYVEHYNNVRLNSAIGYIKPKDMLGGRQEAIQAERDQKLEARPETTADSSPASRLTDRKHQVERAVSSINTNTSSFDL